VYSIERLAMAEKQRAISINVIQSDPREVLFAEFLRSTSGIKSHLLNAGYAHWYSIALAENGGGICTEVELALIKSLSELSAQMTYLIEYHRIKHNIHLPLETLKRCGVVVQVSERTSGAKSVPTVAPPLINKVEDLTDHQSDNAELIDDDDDFFTGADDDFN
jgi:hypothetical protein